MFYVHVLHEEAFNVVVFTLMKGFVIRNIGIIHCHTRFGLETLKFTENLLKCSD